jgi:hypothetical protein
LAGSISTLVSYEPKLAKRLPTRRVRLARMIGIQAIRNAVVNDLVVRSVADLAAVPTQLRENGCGPPSP